ncbi:MAG TPA: hypothetical protein VF737_10495 [Gemmatimonadaceae bacterium]
MDHHAKLRWARKHFEALQADIARFMDANPYELRVRFDQKRQQYVAALRAPRPLPRDWSLRLGDILHNTRSALDSLVHALAGKHLGRMPSDDEARCIRFVIVDERAAWSDESGRWLAHVSPEVRAKIETLQPYHHPPVRYHHPLSVLRDLTRIDRHRHIALVAEAPNNGGVPVEGPGLRPGTRVTGWRGRFVTGGEIPVVDVKDGAGRKLEPALQAEMRGTGRLCPEITFVEGPPGHGGSVAGFITALHRHVMQDVFRVLDEWLD